MRRRCCCADGEIICLLGCLQGGKAYFIGSQRGSFTFAVSAVSGLPIVNNSLIRIYKWSQLPNLNLTGMSLATQVNLGSSFSFTFDDTYRWLSVFAQNNNNGGFYDGCCFNISGSDIRILGFN